MTKELKKMMKKNDMELVRQETLDLELQDFGVFGDHSSTGSDHRGLKIRCETSNVDTHLRVLLN